MKHTKIILFLLSCALACIMHAEKKVITLIRPRSASTNAALELVGLDRQIYIPHQENQFYAVATVTPEAIKTFRPARIAQCLFGDDVLICPKHLLEGCPEKRACQNVFLVSGSRVPDRDCHAWLADYFGLPTDFQSSVHIRPRVHSLVADFNLYCGFDNITPGLYGRIHAPLEHTSWNMDICELIDNPGDNGYVPGYFNASGVERTDLLPSFLSFISGCHTPDIDGVIFHPLTSAKMNPHRLALTKFSEIELSLGYNVFYARCYHLGIDIRMSIPTGNRPEGKFLFEPIVGNCHHWQAGVGLTGHVVAWENVCSQESFAIHTVINITHLFNARQRRIFDLKDKPLSRYMLAATVSSDIVDNLRGTVDGNFISPSFQFSNEYTSVANLTTVDVDTSVNVQADMVLMLTYAQERFSWNIGYGMWAQTCENIQPLCHDPCLFAENTWALKGDAQAFGFLGDLSPVRAEPVEANGAYPSILRYAASSYSEVNPTLAKNPGRRSLGEVGSGRTARNNYTDMRIITPLHAGDPVALSFSEQEATIHTGTNFAPDTTDFPAGEKNPNIDNPAPATAGNNNTRLLYAPDVPNITDNQINTSINPIVLTPDMINLESSQTRAFSQKLFMHMHYTITSCKDIIPHFGFGAEVDFGRGAGFMPPQECRKCINSALSYWGIWVKVGVTFE